MWQADFVQPGVFQEFFTYLGANPYPPGDTVVAAACQAGGHTGSDLDLGAGKRVFVCSVCSNTYAYDPTVLP